MLKKRRIWSVFLSRFSPPQPSGRTCLLLIVSILFPCINRVSSVCDDDVIEYLCLAPITGSQSDQSAAIPPSTTLCSEKPNIKYLILNLLFSSSSLSLSLRLYVSIHPSIYRSIYPSIHPSICLSVYLSINLYICL